MKETEPYKTLNELTVLYSERIFIQDLCDIHQMDVCLTTAALDRPLPFLSSGS